jgi:hypothetical protein
MASVTANGRTTTDDANPLTGLDDGGHVERLVPMLSDCIVEMSNLLAGVSASGTRYLFDTGTVNADPGPGYLRANNASLSAATALFVDVQNAAASDMSVWLADMAASTSAVKGRITLRNANGLKWCTFNVTGVTVNSGYYSLAVTYRAPASAPTFTAAESVILMFDRTGDLGATGAVVAAGDGTINAPGMAFASEPGLGIRRKGAALAALTAGGVDVLEFRFASQAEAEAGTNTLALMNAQRVLQSIRRNGVGNPGGQTVTGDVTLTVTSSGAILANPTGAGFFATLPAANLMPTAGPGVFSIFNASAFYYGIRNNAGTRLGWVPPCSGVVIDLVSNGTAAGTWNCVGAEKVAVTAEFVNASALALGSYRVDAVDMGSNRTLLLIGGTSLYGVVYDGATRAWGALTLIRSGIDLDLWAGVRSVVGTQALVCSCGAASTNFEAVTLTIATTAITVNTAATATLASAPSRIWQVAAVSTSWAVGYLRTPDTTGLRALTISGTTVTIGAETVVSTAARSGGLQIYAAGAVLRLIHSTSSGVVAQPYTVSGVTLTAGTAATAATSTTNNWRAYQNSNGNIVVFYQNAAANRATGAVFRLTGTTEAVSVIDLGFTQGFNDALYDFIDLGAGKALIAGRVAATSNSPHVNILTDTAGTASVGTAFTTGTTDGIAGPPVCLFAGGGVARVALTFNNGTVAPKIKQFTFNVSGASPALTSVQTLEGVISSQSGAGDAYLRRGAGLLRAAGAVYLGRSAALPKTDVIGFTSAGVVVHPRPKTGVIDMRAASVNEFQSWAVEPIEAGFGLIVNQWEVAE